MPMTIASIKLTEKIALCGTARNACDALWHATGLRTRDDHIKDWAVGKRRPPLVRGGTPPIVTISAWLGVHVEDWWTEVDLAQEQILPGPDVVDPWQVPTPDWSEELWQKD